MKKRKEKTREMNTFDRIVTLQDDLDTHVKKKDYDKQMKSYLAIDKCNPKQKMNLFNNYFNIKRNEGFIYVPVGTNGMLIPTNKTKSNKFTNTLRKTSENIKQKTLLSTNQNNTNN